MLHEACGSLFRQSPSAPEEGLQGCGITGERLIVNGGPIHSGILFYEPVNFNTASEAVIASIYGSVIS